MTVPRDLGLEKIGDAFLITSRPSEELNILADKPVVFNNISEANFDLTAKTGRLTGPARLTLRSDKLEPFVINLQNDGGEKLSIGYDKATNHYFIDRTRAGKNSFQKDFAARHAAPRLSGKDGVDLTLIIDNASVELFADNGLTVMTEIFFPDSLLSKINIQSSEGFKIQSLTYSNMKSIWK